MVQSPSQPASSRFPAPSARIVGALAAALCLAPACQRADSSAPATQDPRLGHARVAARISAQRSQGSATAVCAQWTLTPFSIDAAGGQTQAGDPVTFTSTSAAAGTAFIAGCLDAGAGGPNPDWGYWVTASHFDDCAGNPVPGLAPAIATSEVTFDCVAGEDQPIGVSVDVSIATPDDTGYIDIGLGVNSASVPVSCKQADGSETGGPLHFGDAALVGPDAPIPPAYTALGVLSPGSAAATPASDLSLFASATTGSDGSYGFVNGLVDLPPAPQTLTVVQTFQPKDACAANQMTVELAAPACVTTATSGTPAHTQAGLADLFASWPGLGAVTAFISGSQLTLYTSLGGPRWTTVQPASTDHDDLSQAQTLTLPGPVLGVWPDQQAGGQLDALVQTSGGPALAVLSLNTGSGAWVAGALQALPSQANLQAMGLFAHSGCYALPPPPAGGACLPGADYSVRNQIYFQMEPDQVQLPGWTVDLDNEATGCQAGGVCAGDLFGNWSHRTFVYQPSGGAVGGYFSFPQNAQGDINGTLAHAALTGAHAATVEFLFRPSDFSYNGASTILGLWGSSDKSRVRFDAANAAVVIEMGAAYTHLNAAGAPTAVTTSITATFGLWGPASSSWQHVTDGQFHHFAITFDLDAGKGQLFVDGATDARWLLPLSGMPPAGSSNTALLGGNVFTMSTNFWNEDLTGDLDEVAVSEGVLPQALLAQHAQEAAAGQHYTFVESCQAPTPEALTWDNSPLLTDFVPTGTGQLPQDPWQVPGTANVPAQDEAQQLSDWPAPRYLAGHTVPRMEHWVDPTYYGWLPPGTLTGPQRTALQNAATAEEMRTWNYYGPATYGTRALSADPTLPRALAWHEFWGGPTDTSLPFPSSAYFADHSLKHDEGLAAARAAGAAKAHLIEASLAGAGLLPADVQLYITEDGEVANPAIASHTQYSCPTLATSPSDWAAYTAELCYGGACDPATVDCANHPSTSGYGAWFHAQLRLA
ncbi:MAG: hypothetical protein JST92_23540, partial [Deltaproteobacteria bacterium]|nr:hypothetical protein [Deltaproteobacteria bacterium]